MPELPEVEIVKRSLEKTVTGLTIKKVKVNLPKMVRTMGMQSFEDELYNKKIKNFARRGKYLLVKLTGNLTMVIHLRMTGKLIYCPADAPPSKHTHIFFELDNNYHLRFEDTRQFGKVILVPTRELGNVTGLKTLGIEPFDKNFTKEFLKKHLRHKRAKIKPLLLDQTFIAGLGNIYADEILYRARINPEKLANNLTTREASNLFYAIQDVLTEGIKYRGTTVRDFVNGNGEAGRYQSRLQVYGREGKPCPHCGNIITRKKVGGRSSYFCPSCQKLR